MAVLYYTNKGLSPFFYTKQGPQNSTDKQLEELAEKFGIHKQQQQSKDNPYKRKYWQDLRKDSEASFKKVIEFNASIGITYSDLLKMDQGTLIASQRGFIINRERELNDLQVMNQRLAAKIAQAVWNDKHFKDLKPIELNKGEDEKSTKQIINERNNKVLATLKRFGVIGGIKDGTTGHDGRENKKT